MSSSLMPAPSAGIPVGSDLLRALISVPDSRKLRGVRHLLPAVLAVGLAAVLAGARSLVAVGEWVAHQLSLVLASLGVTGSGPGESTIRRVLAAVDADVWTRGRGC